MSTTSLPCTVAEEGTADANLYEVPYSFVSTRKARKERECTSGKVKREVERKQVAVVMDPYMHI